MQKYQSVVASIDRNIETIVDMLRQGQKVDLTSPFYEGRAITTFEPDVDSGPLAFTTSTVIELDEDCQLARRVKGDPEVNASIVFIADVLSAGLAERVRRVSAARGSLC